MQKTPLKVISKKYAYTSSWDKARFKVREDLLTLPGGSQTVFYVVECPEGVLVVPLTGDNKILLVKLFRYRTQRGGWELPAGSVDPGETRQAAALRELQEETGFCAKHIQELPFSFDAMNGASDAVSYVYVASNLTLTNKNQQDDEGISDVQAFSYNQILTMIQNGEITDGMSIAALMKYYITKTAASEGYRSMNMES